MNTHINAALRHYAAKRGVAQKDIAAHLGCTPGAVCHYFTGRRTPNLLVTQRIAKYLDIPVDWLLTCEETPRIFVTGSQEGRQSTGEADASLHR